MSDPYASQTHSSQTKRNPTALDIVDSMEEKPPPAPPISPFIGQIDGDQRLYAFRNAESAARWINQTGADDDYRPRWVWQVAEMYRVPHTARLTPESHYLVPCDTGTGDDGE